MDDRAIELLTCDDEGHAIEGMKVPADRGGAIIYEPRDPDYRRSRDRLAYRHKFFRYDVDGRPMPETLVEFFVPDWMCENGAPRTVALMAVEERMGWARKA